MSEYYDESPPFALDRLADEADYAVVGPTDGRTRVTGTNRFPHSAVCHLERDFGDGRLTGCTAFLIAPMVLLTAAHCIMSPIRARIGLPNQAARIRITPGRASASVRPFGSQWAQSWRVNPAYRRRPSAETDVGLIFLARPFSPSPAFFPAVESVASRDRAVAGHPAAAHFGLSCRQAVRDAVGTLRAARPGHRSAAILQRRYLPRP